MTLILWKAPVVDDPDVAAELLQPYYDREDDSAFEASDDLDTALQRLLERYPFDPETDSAPWADRPELTGRLLSLSIRWGGDDRILADIMALARIHDLVLYDPQGPDIFLPTASIEQLPATPPIKPAIWFKILAMVAVLSALTYAAWLIPVGWLRWPAVLIAGFFAAAAIFVLGCMVVAPQIMGTSRTGS
jgi:hypothetical protein